VTASETLEVITLYRQKLESLNIKKNRYPIDKLLPLFFPRQRALEHCHQMLDTMEEFVREDRMDKAFRWLGFVQGVLWVCRLTPVAELKEHNRPRD